MNWHRMKRGQAIDELGTHTTRGLSEEEAASRLVQFGVNKLNEKRPPSLLFKFFQQFNDFMILVLLAAGVVSLVIALISGEGDYADPIIIFTVVVVNAILGIMQESRAEKALEALKKMSTPMAKVMRGGHLQHIDSTEVVPGDILILEAGDMVPADARLLTCFNLKAEESALTGESVPSDKDIGVVSDDHPSIGDMHNMVFSGSLITYGRASAVAVSTGMNTEMGKIAAMIMDDDAPETPLQRKLGETGKMLAIGALVICVAIFFIGVLRKNPVFEMFMTSISLAVAAIPEGLPAIVTIMLAIGVQRMAKRNAIIRKLPAVEALGSATVICSDKTGTLTQNKMKLVEVSNGRSTLALENDTRLLMLEHATLCSDCFLDHVDGEPVVEGDPTEVAFVNAALEVGIDKNDLEREMPRVSEVPFDSKRKLMTTVHRSSGGGYVVITKGAPDMLLERCTHYLDGNRVQPLDSRKRREIADANGRMANRALRVLATAYQELDSLPYKVTSDDLEHDLVFVGLAGMMDPPRPEVAEAVKICRHAGIRPVMITGDHSATAMAVARKIGIFRDGDKTMSGSELEHVPQDELEKCIDQYSVFSRVSPEHKVRIVKAFQAQGNIVAMTGDGVNDAPALKSADIGCAMGINGTEVAKGSADMVLIDDNFATIVHAVREGRGIYANIRKAVHFLLSSNIGEIITIFVAIVLGWETPLLAIHLLWVNLVTDSLPAIALGVDPPEDDIMDKPAHRAKSSLFDGGLWYRIGLEGCMIGMLALIAFGIGTIFFDQPGSHAIGRTMSFAVLSLSQLVHSFNMRSDKSLIEIDIFSNKQLVIAFITGVALQVGVITIPALSSIFKVSALSPTCWLIVALLSLMPVAIVELEKLVGRRKERRSPALMTETE